MYRYRYSNNQDRADSSLPFGFCSVFPCGIGLGWKISVRAGLDWIDCGLWDFFHPGVVLVSQRVELLTPSCFL